MEALEVLDLIDRAESSTIQLKQDLRNSTQLASEMVAFSNTRGGIIIVGVSKEKDIIGLSDPDIERVNQLISNASDQNVRPPISPITEIVKIENKKFLLISVDEGVNKPYATNEGIHWGKKGSDKRRLSQEELQRLFQDTGRICADGQIINGATSRDIDRSYFEEFYEREYEETIDQAELPLDKLLSNLKLSGDNGLKLAGLLLFGKKPQDFKPAFQIKAVSFYGNDPTDTHFKDSEDIKGKLLNQYENTLGFILRNLRKIQNGNNFNQEGEPEIPRIVLEELLVNALVHRDYFINAPVNLFVFDDRLEITSPGKLPNNLTVEHIKNGISAFRNPVITSFASHILPYRGVGTGIRRSIKNYPHIEFQNDIESERFRVIIKRMILD